MNCPSDKCGSSNVQSLPLYVNGLPQDAPNRRKYAQPAEGDKRARLIAVLAAVAGLVLALTGNIAIGLVVLVGGAAGVAVTHQRIGAADAARAQWQRRQICLACTHLWSP